MQLLGTVGLLTIFDELGQVRGPRSELLEALEETAIAGQLAPLSIIISTQAQPSADLLSVLIDDALAGHDPRVICSLYTAPPDADRFDLQRRLSQRTRRSEIFKIRTGVSVAADAERMLAREGTLQNTIIDQKWKRARLS